MKTLSSDSEIPRFRGHGLGAGLWIVLVFTTLSAACAADPNPVGKRHPVTVGGRQLFLELALDNAARQLGLMYRSSMEDSQGMLFVFPYDTILNFWMKNTRIPLSVAYIGSDGIIKEIHDMEPGNLQPVSSTHHVRYALELNRGAFGRLGIEVGDRMEIQDWHTLADPAD